MKNLLILCCAFFMCCSSLYTMAQERAIEASTEEVNKELQEQPSSLEMAPSGPFPNAAAEPPPPPPPPPPMPESSPEDVSPPAPQSLKERAPESSPDAAPDMLKEAVSDTKAKKVEKPEESGAYAVIHVKPVTMNMSQGSHDGFKVEMPYASDRDVSKSWKKVMKKAGTKPSGIKGHRGEDLSDNAEISSLHADTIDFYTIIGKGNRGASITLFANTAEGYVSQHSAVELKEPFEKFLYNFAVEQSGAGLDNAIGASEKDMDKLQKEGEKLMDRQAKLKGNIKENEKSIADREKQLEDKQKELEGLYADRTATEALVHTQSYLVEVLEFSDETRHVAEKANLEELQRQVSSLNDQISSVEKDMSKMRGDNQKDRIKIVKDENEVAENISEQARKEIQILAQREIISQLRLKRNNLK